MKLKVIITLVCIIIPNIGNADNCRLSTCTSASPSWGSTDYCSSGHKSECWYVEGVTTGYVKSCTACSGNRTLKSTRAGMCSNLKYTECVCSNNCKDIEWTAGNEGYEYSVTCGADCDTTRKYRCAKNWYGTSTNGTSGCNRCWEAAGAVTKAAGSTSPTDCYIPSGTAFSDSSGKGRYTADCYYTK